MYIRLSKNKGKNFFQKNLTKRVDTAAKPAYYTANPKTVEEEEYPSRAQHRES